MVSEGCSEAPGMFPRSWSAKEVEDTDLGPAGVKIWGLKCQRPVCQSRGMGGTPQGTQLTQAQG